MERTKRYSVVMGVRLLLFVNVLIVLKLENAAAAASNAKRK